MNRVVARITRAGLGLLGLIAPSGGAAAQSALPASVYSEYAVTVCPARVWSGDYRWQTCILTLPAIPARTHLRVTHGSCVLMFQHDSGSIARFYLAYVPTSQAQIPVDTADPAVSARKFNFVSGPPQVHQPASTTNAVVMQSQATLPGTAVLPGGTRPAIVAIMNDRKTKGALQLNCTLVGDLAG